MADIMLLSCGHSECESNGGMCHLIWCKLPEDLLIEVLCRLPDKPLVQFKCVSKAWNYFIANVCVPRLDSSAPVSGFMFRVVGRSGFLTWDGHYNPRLMDSCLMCRSTMMAFNTMLGGFVGCFNGLFLLSVHFSGPYMRYYVHNPATNQCVAIPVNPIHNPEHKDKAFVGMAFDPMHPYPNNNNYKIVRISPSSDKEAAQVLPDFDVFSSVTRKWVCFQVPLDPDTIGSNWVFRSVYLKGKFYLLSFTGHLVWFDLDAAIDDNNNYKLGAGAIELPVKVTSATSDSDVGSISLSGTSLYYSRDDQVRFNVWLVKAFVFIPKYSISIDELRKLPCGKHLSHSFIPFMADPASGVIYIGNQKVVLKYYLETNKLELFHKFKKIELRVARICFYPYKRCLVRLSEVSSDKCRLLRR